MKKYLKFTGALALSIALFALPAVVGASLVGTQDCVAAYQNCWGGLQPREFIKQLINILLGVAGLIAVLFVIIGGFQYIFSGANEEWAESGKKTLRNAVIGIVIIVLSFVIVNVISTALQATN